MKPVFYNKLGLPVYDAHNPEGVKKLKIDQSEQFTMIEHIDDYGAWSWWDILRDITPEEAIAHYLKEVGLEQDATQRGYDNVLYAKSENVRAYYITI